MMNDGVTPDVPYYDTPKYTSTAPIKSDHVQWHLLSVSSSEKVTIDDDDAAEGRPALDEPQAKRPKRDRQRKQRGQNKSRHFDLARDPVALCHYTSREQECRREACKFSHDIKDYLASKPEDIQWRPDIAGLDGSLVSDVPPGSRQCPLLAETGACGFGYRCRFLGSHVDHLDEGGGFQGSALRLKLGEKAARLDSEQLNRLYDAKGELNIVPGDIRSSFKASNIHRTLPASFQYLSSIGATLDDLIEEKQHRRAREKAGGKAHQNGVQSHINASTASLDSLGSDSVAMLENKADLPQEPCERDNIATPAAPPSAVTSEPNKETVSPSTADVDDVLDDGPPDVPVRAAEKRTLDFRDRYYLAPLTTVGNLPFRRLCADYGSDVHCGEMGLASEYLSGSPSEWALSRRHPCERTFGVQICGSRPHQLVPAAEAIVRTCPDIDFVDVNCGCPIDLIVKKGAGSALLEHAGKLGKSLVGMSRVLGEVPLTIKLRTGFRDKDLVAHKFVGKVREWGVGSVALHGRTRQQRYTKLADYAYIKRCVQALRAATEDDDLPRIPFLGNGDAYDWRDFWSNIESTGVDTVMVARGALIKPWCFTEFRERRDWDISARERLDGIGRLANYGLAHWGSDTQGVNTTRRFLCEALSFQYRYVPVGLLERLPAHLNERPLPYRGRDELETLLASDSAADWDRIAAMFLGPPPGDWKFVPKHKSNAYEANG